MKILLTSIGSRGDMEPFMALAEQLREANHEVVCLFPEQFKSMVEATGLRFLSLGTEFIDMINSSEGKAVMCGSSKKWKTAKYYMFLAKKYLSINKAIVKRQKAAIEAEKPDKIVYHPKTVYPLIWSIKHPQDAILLSPVPYVRHAVSNRAHIGFAGKNYGSLINKLSYWFIDFIFLKTVMSASKHLNCKVTTEQIKNRLDNNKTMYAVSTSLFSKPQEWQEHVKVVGFHQRPVPQDWQASPELQDFLARHQKILFISFGSMINSAPEERTKNIVDILQKHKIPAIINISAGGLSELKNVDKELIHFASQMPYEWILPKVYAAMHHGGSGTVHMTLKHGCPTLVIPHIIDQFFWNELVAEQKCGPAGTHIKKLKPQELEAKILDLWQNKSYKQKAEKLAQKMSKEDFRKEIIDFITK